MRESFGPLALFWGFLTVQEPRKELIKPVCGSFLPCLERRAGRRKKSGRAPYFVPPAHIMGNEQRSRRLCA